MSNVIFLTQVTAIHNAVIEAHVRPRDLSQFVPAACGEVWSYVRAAPALHPGRHVALYREHHLVEVGVEVVEPFTGNDRVHCSCLPAGHVATLTHFGPYSALAAAHDTLRQWCMERDLAPAAVCWEIYAHWEQSWNQDPSAIRTDIFHLLQPCCSPLPIAPDV